MAATKSTLRHLLRELRTILPPKTSDSLAAQYIMSQYRQHQTTSETICKAREELSYLSNTYLCYLQSQRLAQKIEKEFRGKGQRSVRETANLVGFKLPHDPK